MILSDVVLHGPLMEKSQGEMLPVELSNRAMRRP